VSSDLGEQLMRNEQLAALDAEIQNAVAAADQLRVSIVGVVAEIEQTLSTQPAQSAAADTSAQALSQRVNALAQRSGLAPNDQQRVAQLRMDVTQLAEQEAAIEDRDAERAALVSRQRLVGGQVAEANRRILALQASVVPEADHFERIHGEAAALASMSPLGASAFLAQGHPA